MFNFADVYGPSYGYNTTRLESVPDQADQEVLVDDTTASSDVHTDPASSRNMLIGVGAVIAVIVLFSINW